MMVDYLSDESIEKLADAVREQVDAIEAPIDPFEIADDFWIKPYTGGFDVQLVDGMIRRDEDGQYEIFTNSTHSVKRQRFTCAHELGHYFLHMLPKGSTQEKFVDTKMTLYRSSEIFSAGLGNDQARLEIQANKFAAALLMPKNLMKRFIGGPPEYAASFFQVSAAAMAIRLRSLSQQGA